MFDCSTSPVSQCLAMQTGTLTFTGRICVAFDVAVADWVVSLRFDAPCHWSTSPPTALPDVASPSGGCVAARRVATDALWDCSFDWTVWFPFHADVSPEAFVFDCLTSPVWHASARQTGTFRFTGRTCVALDVAVASCVVLFVFAASCDWVTSPP